MSDTIQVRSFEDADELQVGALWLRVFPDDPPRNEPGLVVRRKQAVDDDLFLVAERDGRVVGAVVAGYDGYRGWVYHLAVDPDLRRRGIGRALMSEAERRLKALGCPKLNLQVRGGNEAVVGFYRALGYAVEERVSLGKTLD